MNEEILKCLSLASQALSNARFAGTARHAIADGYAAVDAAFSAILDSFDIKRSYNHEVKLNQVKQACPDLLDIGSQPFDSAALGVGVAWDEIEALYKEWLQARYDAFDMPAGLVRQRLRRARRVFENALQLIATREGKTRQELKALVEVRAFGSTDAPLYDALGAAHDHVFAEAEYLGEQNGSRLGIKMAAATNFSEVDFVASDEMTREIIKNDERIASECAQLHVRLCNLMEMLRSHRYNALVSDGRESKVAHNESTDFMFALRFKYHGETLAQTGENLSRVIQLALGQIVQPAPVVLTDK